MKKIRTRFAPSPTGYMHVGNFRTALYAFLFAKQNKGDFILRIEDTDKKRQIENGVEKLIKIINWAGFEYSEGVFWEEGKLVQKGDFGPYIQSERLKIYQDYAQKLVEKGLAYHCFCSAERLEKMRQVQKAEKLPPMYDRKCLQLSPEEVKKRIAAGEKYVIRQKMRTEGATEFVDLIRQKVVIKNNQLDDQILMKSDGFPTYNFANVIDDHLMAITHVFRGEEYVSSTPKYIQLYENFNWEVPCFVHLPLLLNTDRSKLSKRQGDVAVEDYIAKGYLREAIINFVALLGWNPGGGNNQEIFSLEELVKNFQLEKVHKSGAIFDLKKLDWLNGQYIKRKSPQELLELSRGFLQEFCQKNNWPEKEELFLKIVSVEKERMKKIADILENLAIYFHLPEYTKEILFWKGMDIKAVKNNLVKAEEILEELEETASLEEITKKILLASGENRGELLWPMRVALSGKEKSPSPFELIWALGKKESLRRIKRALEKLEENK